MNDKRSKERDEVASQASSTVSRRHLILFGVSASAFSLLSISGCKKGPPSTCSDVTGLTTDEINVRNNVLAYTDQSPYPDKNCTLCQQYNAPPSIDQCGSCKVLKGPVHPNGYCKSFLKK